MKRTLKNLLAFALVAVLALGSLTFVSAEDTLSDSVIYFEAPDFWDVDKYVFCNIYVYGGDALSPWQGGKARCTKVDDNLYAYDISKVGALEKGEYYSVIFSSDMGNQTFDTILSTKCIGDTLYCDGNIVEEPTASRLNTAYWKNTFPIMVGDTNLDKKVTVQDATRIQKVIAFVEEMPVHWLFMLDANGDTNVNIKDATEIQKWLAKLPANDKIGVFYEEVQPSTAVTEPVDSSDDEPIVLPPTCTEVIIDPTESGTAPTVPTTSSSDDPQEATDPTDNTDAQETTPTTPTEGEEPELDPYQREVIAKFVEQGFNPAEEGMFYRVCYSYRSDASADEATPDYVLIWTSVGGVADEVFEVTIGDYVLTCPGHCSPYLLGYYIYIPSTDTLLTIEEAYHQRLEGLETVFEEYPAFRPVEVDFKIIDQQSVSWYGSEETELFLLRHSSHEENVTAKFERGKAPEINIPADEKGFYYDKIYLVSLNFLGGGNSAQTIDKITVVDHTLTIYRTITSPELQTTDMNYQYVLIELDASLSESISELEDFTVKNIVSYE